MAVRHSVGETPNALPAPIARHILKKSLAHSGARFALLLLLLHADGNGVITGYTRDLARLAGWEPTTLRAHLLTLWRLGELDIIRSPTNRLPGIWRINALS